MNGFLAFQGPMDFEKWVLYLIISWHTKNWPNLLNLYINFLPISLLLYFTVTLKIWELINWNYWWGPWLQSEDVRFLCSHTKYIYSCSTFIEILQNVISFNKRSLYLVEFHVSIENLFFTNFKHIWPNTVIASGLSLLQTLHEQNLLYLIQILHVESSH